MNKKLILLILIFLAGMLEANIIAEVGDYEITSKMLREAIALNEEEIPYKEKRNQALEQLISNCLLKIFAEEKGIEVNDEEVDEFFITRLGDHPKLLTDGEFDFAKFEELKSSPEVIKILHDMREDLLLQKTKTVLLQSFDVSETELLEEFVKRNTTFDIGYAKINAEEVDVPFGCNPRKAFEYYNLNKDKYPGKNIYNVEYILLLNKDFEDDVFISASELKKMYEESGIEKSFEEAKSGLRGSLVKIKTEEKAYLRSIELRKNWQNGEFLSEFIFSAVIDDRTSYIGNIPETKIIFPLLEKAAAGDVFEPIKFDKGQVLIRLASKESTNTELTAELAEKIWHDYVDYEKRYSFADLYKKYYWDHIDDFIIPVTVIKRIILDPSETLESVDHIRSKIQDSIFDDKELKKLSDKYSLDISEQIVYMNNKLRQDEINSLIVDMIKSKPNQSAYYVTHEDKIIYYRIETIFPEYIPSFDELKSEIYKFVDNGENADYEEELREFFNLNIDKFMSEDSLKTGGVFIKAEPDTLDVSNTEIEEYYFEHKEDFFRESAVKISYIYIEDYDGSGNEKAKIIENRLNAGADFEQERLAEGKPGSFPENEWIYLYRLPEEIVVALEEMRDGEYSQPIYCKTGYYILKKIKQKNAFYPEINELREEITAQIKWNRGKEIAYRTAKAVYDSTDYYVQCKIYADSTQLFETEMLPINADFPPLGKLGKNKKSLAELRKYDKLNRIINNHAGYAIVFMLGKSGAEPMTFETAEPLARRAFHQYNTAKHGKLYLADLRGQLRAGADPDSLFFFFGKWKVVKNKKFGSEVDEIEYWNYILEDAVSRSPGYVSQPLKLPGNKYLIYRIENMHKASSEVFKNNKEDFRKKLKEMRYRRWLVKFGAETGIKKYD